MTDSIATIDAKIVRSLHRGGFYYPSDVPIDGLVGRTPIANSDRGKCRDRIHALANDDTTQVRYKHPGQTVCLKVNSSGWVEAFIREKDADQLPPDLRDDLRIIKR